MKYILEAQVINPYRSKTPRGFYNPLKGHSGVDLNYNFEELPSPVSGKISKVLVQNEMGNVIYLDDAEHGNIHVFAHMSKINVKPGDHVMRNQILGITGNSGAKTTGCHLHYELLTFKKPERILDRVMTRSLAGFVGWNIDPLQYVRDLYGKYKLDNHGNQIHG